MKNGKRVLFFLSVFCTCFCLAKFAQHQTLYFTLFKIKDSASFSPFPNSPMSFPEELKQPYVLFAKGRQAFCFLSQDKQVVLKIFKNKAPLKKPLFTALKLLPFLGKIADKKLQAIALQKEKLLTSLLIGTKTLNDSSFFLASHLFVTDTPWPKVELIDAQNISHFVDLSASAFVLQAKGTPFFEHLLHLSKEKAQALLNELIEKLLLRMQQGIQDLDPHLRHNVVVIEDKVAFVDIGSLSFSTECKEKSYQKKELTRILAILQEFLLKNDKTLYDYLNKTLDEQILPSL